jgi:D-glycero-D-manno-heptose 1,7-bisphosphate phosphatase
MLTAAALEFIIDLEKSYMIGDRWSDINAGKAAGCFTILFTHKYKETLFEQPDVSVSSLLEAVHNILKEAV